MTTAVMCSGCLFYYVTSSSFSGGAEAVSEDLNNLLPPSVVSAWQQVLYYLTSNYASAFILAVIDHASNTEQSSEISHNDFGS